ncbi:sec-independent protein translocase protein TatB [Desulfatibacillum alkenivorans DSM 16219]|jgi:sec-independent protein translocase protein TatB|uniref:Sec-independent protein translocase protein TatB n=1 Tax=Desulfatibacillum alkenivorans DSM 16219 TaxID=1121393 RepID=A0A1M6MPV0_9BACT|nr:twin-arginine translocase TatA/TatE family subunit [Desulfatibacillum alkenivorans]SHJ85390.1 sec-independent protein translocase protein TatB [Desulfatibacillum alkenivorans DSM 16219]
MFGIGMQELVVILLVALIFIGPKKLPEIAQALGKGFAEFRKATQDIKDSLDIDNDVSQVKSAFQDMQNEVKGAVSDAKQAPKIWEDPPSAKQAPEPEPDAIQDSKSPEDPYSKAQAQAEAQTEAEAETEAVDDRDKKPQAAEDAPES